MANTVEAVSEGWIRLHNVHVVAFPFACVFTLAFTSMFVIDLFSVIYGRNRVLVQEEQCSGVCTKISLVFLLTLYLVRIHASLWEEVPPSSWRSH